MNTFVEREIERSILVGSQKRRPHFKPSSTAHHLKKLLRITKNITIVQSSIVDARNIDIANYFLKEVVQM